MTPSEVQFCSLIPAESRLRPFIAYYYFQTTHSDQFRRTFTYYPNFRVALNAFERSSVQWDNQERRTLPQKEKSFTKIITFSKAHSRDVQMVGRINKLGVIFEPLGINRFLTVPLGKLLKSDIDSFEHFGPEFDRALYELFKTEDLARKREILDRFFLDRFNSSKNQLINSLVEELLQSGDRILVDQVAEQNGINRRTLLRHFQQELGCSLRSYSSLVKFREVLRRYQQETGPTNLTQLAYDCGFCDQAALNKLVKQFTSLTPRRLLLQLPRLDNQHTVWTLKK